MRVDRSSFLFYLRRTPVAVLDKKGAALSNGTCSQHTVVFTRVKALRPQISPGLGSVHLDICILDHRLPLGDFL